MLHRGVNSWDAKVPYRVSMADLGGFEDPGPLPPAPPSRLRRGLTVAILLPLVVRWSSSPGSPGRGEIRVAPILPPTPHGWPVIAAAARLVLVDAEGHLVTTDAAGGSWSVTGRPGSRSRSPPGRPTAPASPSSGRAPTGIGGLRVRDGRGAARRGRTGRRLPEHRIVLRSTCTGRRTASAVTFLTTETDRPGAASRSRRMQALRPWRCAGERRCTGRGWTVPACSSTAAPTASGPSSGRSGPTGPRSSRPPSGTGRLPRTRNHGRWSLPSFVAPGDATSGAGRGSRRATARPGTRCDRVGAAAIDSSPTGPADLAFIAPDVPARQVDAPGRPVAPHGRGTQAAFGRSWPDPTSRSSGHRTGGRSLPSRSGTARRHQCRGLRQGGSWPPPLRHRPAWPFRLVFRRRGVRGDPGPASRPRHGYLRGSTPALFRSVRPEPPGVVLRQRVDRPAGGGRRWHRACLLVRAGRRVRRAGGRRGRDGVLEPVASTITMHSTCALLLCTLACGHDTALGNDPPARHAGAQGARPPPPIAAADGPPHGRVGDGHRPRAQRLGTNTGATSYHLRRLASVGLVEETGEGHGRERPWRAATEMHGWTERDVAGGSGRRGCQRLAPAPLPPNVHRALRGMARHARHFWPLEWQDVTGASATTRCASPLPGWPNSRLSSRT